MGNLVKTQLDLSDVQWEFDCPHYHDFNKSPGDGRGEGPVGRSTADAWFDTAHCDAPSLKPRVYVAGGVVFKSAIQEVQRALRDIGHEVTWDWTAVEKGSAEAVSDAEWAQYSKFDLDGVRTADYVVVVFSDPEYAFQGTFCELGCALGLGKPVIIMDVVDPDVVAKHRLGPFYHDIGVVARTRSVAETIDCARTVVAQLDSASLDTFDTDLQLLSTVASANDDAGLSTPPSDDGLPMPPTTPRVITPSP